MEYLKIKDFAEVVTGGTPSTNKNEYWENGTIPWIQSGSCRDDVVNNPDKYITELGLKNSSAKIMPKNTVIIALTGATTGKVGLLNIETSANQSVTGILPNKKCIPLYLFYYLISIRNKILSDCYGGAQKHISQGYVKELTIPVPEINAQEKFVNRVSILTNLIKIKKKQIKNFNELIKSQFVEMFKDENKYPKEYLKNNVNEMFIGPFGSALKNDCFVAEDNSSCVVYEQKHAINKYIGDFRFVNSKKHEELKRFEVFPDDIIVSCRGTIGETFIIPNNAPLGIMHPSIMKIRLDKNKYNPVFFNEVIKQYLTDNINKTKGGTIKMGIKARDLGNTKFIRPDLNDQIKFLNFKNLIDKQKFVLTKMTSFIPKILYL